ncbi:hypothetical protein BKA93DRAFT_794093 [Sparassis latifolia]
MLCFLEGILESSTPVFSDDGEHDVYIAMGQLLQFSFMSLLFDYRKLFHRIAARDTSHTSAPSTVVCWVDVVLSKLGDAVISLIGRHCTDVETLEWSFSTLKQQRETDSLYAAVQLPDEWAGVPNVINAEHASPAAKRLALQLTFAVYVVGPQLEDAGTMSDQENDVLGVLQLYMNRSSMSDRASGQSYADLQSTEHAETEKVRNAMTLSLFAAMDSIQLDEDRTPFRPHTQAALLHYMTTVMYPDNFCASVHDLVSPCAALNVAQTILLKWGHVVPWCWFLCDDPRIFNSEVIDYVTINWLHHLDSSNKDTDKCAEYVEPWHEEVTSVVATNPKAAIVFVNRILHHTVSVLSTVPPGHLTLSSLDALRKSCWAAAQLLRSSQLGDLDVSSLYAAMCRLFVLLRDGEEDLAVKDCIIECLTSASRDNLPSVMSSILDDTKLSLALRMEEKISGLKCLALDEDERSSLRSNETASFGQLLHFITILWHGNVKTAFRREITLPFINALLNWLVSQSPGADCSVMLRDSLLTSLTVVEPLLSQDGVDRLWDIDVVWQMAMESPPTNLLVASSFAAYVVTTAPSRNQDVLACSEAWDYLRDVLLLVLSHQFLGDEEPLALLVCPMVCQALSSLIHSAISATLQYILSSPWTMNLCTELQQLANASSSDDSTYTSVLRDRTLPFAEALLFHVTDILRSGVCRTETMVRNSDKQSRTGSCLIACRIDSVPRLILVSFLGIFCVSC